MTDPPPKDPSEFSFVKNINTNQIITLSEIDIKIEKAVDPEDIFGPTKVANETEKIQKDTHNNFFGNALHKKKQGNFGNVHCIQEIDSHTGAIWAVKFSCDGFEMATGGQDMVLRVWKVLTTQQEQHDEQRKIILEVQKQQGKKSKEVEENEKVKLGRKLKKKIKQEQDQLKFKQAVASEFPLFAQDPIHEFHGHSADILDISWGKNGTILTASIDKTVRRWDKKNHQSVLVFQHPDFVTSVQFHPKSDLLFITGCFDDKIRIWSIQDKKILYYVDTKDLITAACFSNLGNIITTASYNGMCHFYESKDLEYITRLHVRSKRGKNKSGKKITGIEFTQDDKYILFTSNDSRIRLYQLSDYSLIRKYQGHQNTKNQIKAFLSYNNFIICGSEDGCVYIWEKDLDQTISKKIAKKQQYRNESYEKIQISENIITSAIFTPKNISNIYHYPMNKYENKKRNTKSIDQKTKNNQNENQNQNQNQNQNENQNENPNNTNTNQIQNNDNNSFGMIFITCDFTGIIRVFLNKKSKRIN